MRRGKWILVSAVVLVAASALYALAFRRNGAVVVEVDAVVERPTFRSYVTASGEIVANRFADIGSSVMGKIVKLNVKEGDQAKSGQVLARLDPVQAESASSAATAQVRALEAEELAARQQVQAARSDLAQSRARARDQGATLERLRLLQKDGLTTAADLDAAEAASDAASAQVAAAEAGVSRSEQTLTAASRRIAQARAQAAGAFDILRKTEIVAPIAGTVSRLQVREGEMVVIGIQNQPGTTLMTISDLSAINAEVKVAEADVLRVEVGQQAAVTLEAISGRRLSGRVAEVGSSALPLAGAAAAAREFKVVIRLDQPDPGLRPGLTCDAEILTSQKANVLTVPLQAVVLRAAQEQGGDRTGVFVVKGDTVQFVPVQTGIIGGLEIEVSGVSEGTPVVTGPFQVLRELKEGARVRPSRVSGSK
jgi:HlyD family secretion protein